MFPCAKALVIAAHPDDEMLGCGGTLARLRSAGTDVSVLLLGEGPTARERNDSARASVQKDATFSARAAAKALEITDVSFAGLPDNKFDTLPLLDVTQKIETLCGDTMPDVIFTHFAGDLNMDHRITHQAVMTAFRPLPGRKPMTILGFEVLSSTEYAPPGMTASFHPTLYVDITEHLAAKQKALAAYASEMRPWPHPRSHEAVEHLARLRGSQCGREAAETFVLCRGVF